MKIIVVKQANPIRKPKNLCPWVVDDYGKDQK